MKTFEIKNGKVIPLHPRRFNGWWNYENKAFVSIVRVKLLDCPPGWWCAPLIGTVREAVKVEYEGQTFYLDNEADPDTGRGAGAAWGKVTDGHGSPQYGHRSLSKVEEVTG